MAPGPLSILIAGCIAVAVWLVSLATREYSWTDRIWSIAPVGYAWVFAGAAGLHDARLDLVAALITVWGARLTFNFARKGGYAPGGEDYRWVALRARMKPWQFQGFNLVFIAGYQNLILLVITLPMWTMYDHRAGFGVWDVVLAVVALAVIAGETTADEQQWRFQQAKKSGRTADRFVTTGLFRFSRHPNFFCEVAFWWLVFLFAVVAAHTVVLWTIAGPVLLTLLFVGSTRFTESITLGRYPEYADYQRATSAVIPRPPRARVTSPLR